MLNDEFEAQVRKRMGNSAFSQWMGLELVSLGEGTSEVRLTLEPHHLNPGGIAHGGVIASLLDVAIGLAHRTQLDHSSAHVTIQLQINYLRAVTAGTITAHGTSVHAGSRTGYGEATLTDESGKPLARATGTFLVLPGGVEDLKRTLALDGE
ncbi:MAG: PaaI family thioesterase [Actinomycetota bacterium]